MKTKAKTKVAGFDVLVRSVAEQGVLVFPEDFTQEQIEQLKQMIGPDLFKAQYENNPHD